jgi:hypothetical protein
VAGSQYECNPTAHPIPRTVAVFHLAHPKRRPSRSTHPSNSVDARGNRIFKRCGSTWLTREVAALGRLGVVDLRSRFAGTLYVTVLPHGFECDGVVYASLSATAKAVTGSHCNGFLFFGLPGRGVQP